MASDENNAPAVQDPTVDENPISPSRPDPKRKNSLEQHLKSRPQRADLVDRNILPDSTAAPSLQEKQRELEKSMRADTLNDKISHRPRPEKLIKEGILEEDPRSPEEKYEEAIEDEYAKREGGA